MKVNLFIPCFIDQLYPHIGINIHRILDRLGYEILFYPKIICCGQAACNAGFEGEARKVARKYAQVLDNGYVTVLPSASCAGFIKMYYPNLLQRKVPEVYELSDFLMRFCDIAALSPYYPHQILYHSSCASLREYPMVQSPKNLLCQIKGLEVVDFEDMEKCCGFGGTFALKFGAIALSMAQAKLNHIRATGLHKIVTADMSCMMHLGAFAQKQDYPLETLHISDILAANL